MKEEYFETSCQNHTNLPVVIIGLAILPPEENIRSAFIANRDQMKQLPTGTASTMWLPIGRETGTYEELRKRLHKQVDQLFDTIK